MAGLGIDWRLLIIQTVNFLILFLVLKKWVYPPLIKFLEERAKKIQESLLASEKMRLELKSFEAEKEKERQKLGREAQTILEKTRAEGRIEKEKIIAEAKVTAESMVSSARLQIEGEKQKALREAEKEVGELSLTLAKRILSDLDENQARKLIAESLKETDSQKYGQG